MGMSARDRAFLTDVATTNWMQHFVASGALVSMGARPTDVAHTIKKHHDGELAFFSRSPLNYRVLRAQVQSLGTLRIVQEYVAAMETAGALFRAIHGREGIGGILRSNHRCRPRDVREYFAGIRKAKRRSSARQLNWPALPAITRAGSPDLSARARSLYPWLGDRIKSLADGYVTGKPFQLARLNRAAAGGRDPRSYTYAFVYVLEKGEKRREHDASIIVQGGLNKLKHGFNATVNYPLWREIRGARNGITALVVPKVWPVVNKLGQQVMLVGIMSREAARLTLDMEKEGLI
jgi:hypothetical protein